MMPPLQLSASSSASSAANANGNSNSGSGGDWVINMGGSGLTTQNATPTAASIGAFGGLPSWALMALLAGGVWWLSKKH